MKNKLILFSFLLVTSSTAIISCGQLNNPFLPMAELTVTEVVSADVTKGVSVLQSFKKSGDSVITEYTFNEPTVTIINKPGLPRVIFKKVIVEYTVANKKLPAQTLPTIITIPAGGSFKGSVPILTISEDLINSVFPNSSFSSVSTGLAEVTLLGIDDNNNIIATKFTTPIRFETDPTNFPGTGPSPSPSPSPSPERSFSPVLNI